MKHQCETFSNGRYKCRDYFIVTNREDESPYLYAGKHNIPLEHSWVDHFNMLERTFQTLQQRISHNRPATIILLTDDNKEKIYDF